MRNGAIAVITLSLLAGCSGTVGDLEKATSDPTPTAVASTDSPQQVAASPSATENTAGAQMLAKANTQYLAHPRRQQHHLLAMSMAGSSAKLSYVLDLDATAHKTRVAITSEGDVSGLDNHTLTAITTSSTAYLTSPNWSGEHKGKWMSMSPDKFRGEGIPGPDVEAALSTSVLTSITATSTTYSTTGEVVLGTMSVADALQHLSLGGTAQRMGLDPDALGTVPVKVALPEGRPITVEILAQQVTGTPAKLAALLRSVDAAQIELVAPAEFAPIVEPPPELVFSAR